MSSEIRVHKRKKKEKPRLTAALLYKECMTMQALIAVWIKDKRCPFPLVDLLLEWGLDSQAECARWCASEPDKKQYSSNEFMGVMPWKEHETGWGFYVGESYYYPDLPEANDLPHRHMSHISNSWIYSDTAEEAILALLDGWKP